MDKSRITAVKIIEKFLVKKSWISPLIKSISSSLDLDIEFVSELCYGTLKRMLYIEHVVNALLHKNNFQYFLPLEKSIFLVSFYELLFLNKPPYATVYTYVEIAHNLVNKRFAKLLNALLRRASRGLDVNFPEFVTYSIPEPLYFYLKKNLDQRIFKDFLQHSLTTHPTYIRFFKNSNYPYDYQEIQNVLFPETFRILNFKKFNSSCPPNRFAFQDLSSQIAQHLIPYVPRGTYIDLTAAPCNKSSFLAESFQDVIVLANDVNLRKLLRFKNETALGLKNLFLINSDATTLAFKNDTFDVVIIDAPCSGLGTIRRKPEIKYRISPEKIKELASIQRKILENGATLVKRGGFLIYMTCTVTPDENENQIKEFLERHKDFIIISNHFEFEFSYILSDFGIYIDGSKNDCDYFFVSIIKRR
ncbi:MAG: transcription antitermination factor NusB [Candidatus Hydrothermia bacterium]